MLLTAHVRPAVLPCSGTCSTEVMNGKHNQLCLGSTECRVSIERSSNALNRFTVLFWLAVCLANILTVQRVIMDVQGTGV